MDRKWITIGLVGLLIAAIIIGSNGCSKKSDDDRVIGSSVPSDNKITVKGTFAGGENVRLNWFDRLLANIFVQPAYALDESLVTKVIAFDQSGNYTISNVADDRSFTIGVEKGIVSGLIFAGASNDYLGYLSLQNGIDSLPLMKLSTTATDLTIINLQVLSSTGLIVEPSHNPIGDEIPLTDEEQTAIAQGDDFFASVINNMDIDGDGAIDILDNKFYKPFVIYFVKTGNFVGGDLTPTVTTPASFYSFGFCFGVWDSAIIDFPDTVTFTGPAGSNISNMTNDAPPNVYENSAAYGTPAVLDPKIPPGGVYTVTFNASILTFNIPDQSKAISNVVLSIPTITLTGENILKINWVCKLGDGTDSDIDPLTILAYIAVQIAGDGIQYDTDYPESQGDDRLYNSPNFSPTTTECILPTTDSDGAIWSITWADVMSISLGYEDVFGNSYVVIWDK